MGLYEKIKKLSSDKKISIRKLEEDLGYGNGTIRRWDTATPGVDKIRKVADYFDVSIDYLLGRTAEYSLNSSEEDEELMQIAMMFRKNEEDIPDDKKEQFRKEIEAYMRFVKSELDNK